MTSSNSRMQLTAPRGTGVDEDGGPEEASLARACPLRKLAQARELRS
jgi:hypothetical protein